MTDDKDTSGAGASGAGRRQDPLGSAAEEAMKLLDALQQRMGREFGKGVVKGSANGFGINFGGGDRRNRDHDVWGEAVSEPHGDEYICRACPVCRVIAARKESGGDVADHLIAAGGELFAAVRQAFDALQRPSSGSPGSSSGSSAGSSGPRQGEPRVEHIDLG
ncbi:hypothetical protein GCM10023194_09700 [Planotetraspora phitsanulokensis]|uniref:Uncharacterized protein n=1 Tax=Planotetraspora phitsanulokensis TaxID=575192 RepID=A0A8J3TZ54_9ACTN|nr:hypothetical protein [Planotetraspora phitsanulokensis]GII35274.1 hypothetical protein Pph01_02770 [Planotetraspora phitsanulokensis]